MIPHPENCKCYQDPESWYVNSPDHHNCFWTYIRYNERVHTLQEIAILLNLSISAITTIEHKALKKLAKKPNIQIFKK